jgi:hypothetical protein
MDETPVKPIDPLQELVEVRELPYTVAEGAPDELAVVCANCSYPVVKEFDDAGRAIGFREELGPKDEEQAQAEGWLDHGLGIFCPKCSLSLLEEQERDKAAGAQSGVLGDIGEMIDEQVMRSLCPGAGPDTIAQFVRMFRSERLSKFRVLAGLEPIAIFSPSPQSDAQAQEFLDLTRALEVAKEKLK